MDNPDTASALSDYVSALESQVATLREAGDKLREDAEMTQLHLAASICECGEPLKETDAYDSITAGITSYDSTTASLPPLS